MAIKELSLSDLAEILGSSDMSRIDAMRLLGALASGEAQVLSVGVEDLVGGARQRRGGGESTQDHHIGRGLSRIDLSDYIPKHGHQWTHVPSSDGRRTLVSVARFIEKGAPEEEDAHRDTHVVFLKQEEDDGDAWQLWSCCPDGMKSVVTPFRGDQEHAQRVANFMMDFFTGRTDTSEVARELTDRTVAARNRRRAEQGRR